MKVRWTSGSVRFRITPAELGAIELGQPIEVELAVLESSWRSTIVPVDKATSIALDGGSLTLSLSTADVERLGGPETEGVYFSTPTEPKLRYFVEKDFPCIHPKPEEAEEETFTAPPGFASRHQRATSVGS